MSFSNFEPGPDSERNENGTADSEPDTLPFSWTPYATPPKESEPEASRGEPAEIAEPAPPSAIESATVRSSGAFHTIRTAAAHMGVDPDTLRRQCRNATLNGGVADLGEGIFAFKVGKFWRVRFPWWQ